MITEAQRRGREAAARRRRREAVQQVADFRAWLSLEREAYTAMVCARQTYGPRSPEAHDAEREWLDVLPMLSLPSDAAFEHAAS